MGQQIKTTAPKVVVNASIFLALVLRDEPEDIRQGARRLMQAISMHQIEAHVPERFEDEVLGGLVEAVTKGRPLLATPIAIFMALQRFMGFMMVHRRGVDWSAEEVFNAALRWRVSYYDALYLVVAQKVGATYWTADKKLFRFLQRQKFADLPKVSWIGNFAQKT